MFGRVLLIAGGAIAGVLGLVMVGAHAPAQAGIELAAVLALAAILLALKVPRMTVLWLSAAAVLLAGVVNTVPGIIAAGPMGIIGVAGGLVGMLWMWRRLPGVHHVPPPRGAAFATRAQLRDAQFFPAYGWPLGSIGREVLRLPEKLERENILVTAAPGSGKSAGLVIPAILSEAQRPPDARRNLVILDPKDEVTRKTLPTLSRSHRCLLWDPSNPDACTIGFDPLSTLPSGPSDEAFVAEVKELARAWFEATLGSHSSNEAAFWINQPRSLMEALFLAFVVTHPHGTMVELADWNSTLTIEAFQELLDSSPNPAVHAAAEALRSVSISERTISPIWGDILQRWDILIDPRVRRAMCGRPPIDWSSLLTSEQPTALYLRIGAQDAQRLAPLLSLALGQMYREVTKVAARFEGVLPREMRVIIDEFGNLPQVRNMDTALSTTRSYGVGWYLFCQGSSQISRQYSPILARAIQDAIVTRIVLGGASLEDSKLFSERCGEITEQVPTRSETANGIVHRTHTYGYAPERRPLIPATELIHMAGHVLISTRGIRPIAADLRMYFEDRDLVRQLEEDQREYERAQADRMLVAVPSTPALAAVAEEEMATVALPMSMPANTNHTDAAGDSAGRAMRDQPPPGCTEEEANLASQAMHIARLSLEDSMLRLVTGAVADLDELHGEWLTVGVLCAPENFCAITQEEIDATPHYYRYVRSLAERLEIVDQEGEP